MTAPLRIDGADISHHQPTYTLQDLKAAKAAGLRFLYHKATEGETVRDDEYAARRALAAQAGIPFGAYHFAHPERGDAIAEADAFLAHAKPKPGDLVPALDLETNTLGLSERELTGWVARWVRRVRRHTGVHPVIYTPFDLNNPDARFKLGAEFGCLLWQPRYNDDNRPPVPVEPWREVDLWQFSNGVLGKPDRVPGLGHVDLNTIRSDVRVGDFRIPKPVDELEKSGTLRFMTQNVQARPLMPQTDVEEDVAIAARQAHVVAWQEIGPARYKRAVAALDPTVWDTMWAGNFQERWFDSPISYRSALFERHDGGSFQLHGPLGSGGVRRQFTWLVLDHKNTGARLLVTDKHYVAGAWNDSPKPDKDQRKGWWRDDRDTELKWLAAYIDRHPNHPIVMLGDYNGAIAPGGGQADEWPQKISGRRFHHLVSPKSIDQVILVNGDRWRWEIDDQDGDRLPGRNGDHSGRRGEARLVEVR